MIDTVTVSASNKDALIAKAGESTKFLRALPGFVEGYIFDKIAGDGRFNVITTAVWKDQVAFEDAKKAAAEEYRRIGFNPQEIMAKLDVTIERAVYRRMPY